MAKKPKRTKAGIERAAERRAERKTMRIARDRWPSVIKRNPYADHVVLELSVEDIRDQTVGIVTAHFGGDLHRLREQLGPVPATIRNWEAKRTSNPRMSTLRAALIPCGYDLVVREAP